MQFTKFSQANDVLKAAPGTEHFVQDLPIFRQLPYVVSCVEFGPEELAQLVQTGQVFLQVVSAADTPAEAYTSCFHRFSVVADFDQVEKAEPLLSEFVGANVGTFLFMQPLPGQKLPADSHPCAVACYQLNEAQVATLSETGKLYFKALGTSHPPISVHATNPITFSAPVEPEVTDVLNEIPAPSSN